MHTTRTTSAVAAALLGLALAGCGGSSAPETGTSTTPGAGSGAGSEATQQFPDVRSVELTATGEGTYDVAVTLSSPYDTPERYADGWRVLDQDGTVLGTHELTHDHADEQPFTRTQYDLAIPGGVDRVTVEGRDLQNGFGGTTRTVDVPG